MYLPAIGGAELALANLRAELEKRQIQHILVIPFSNWRKLNAIEKGSRIRQIVPLFPGYQLCSRLSPLLGYILLSAQLTLLQRHFQITCWHAVGAFPIGSMVVRWARLRRVKVVVRCPGEDIQLSEDVGYGLRQNPKIDKFVRRFLPQADLLIAHSDSIKKEYELLDVPQERVVSIPNGVHVEKFRRRGNSAAGQRNSGGDVDAPFTFLFVGRNHPKKGVPTLLKAADQLCKKVDKKLHFNLVGRDIEQWSSTVKGFGLSESINLIPQIHDENDKSEHPSPRLLSFFHTADVFVLPSYVESFGIVLIEAMAAGLPIITTDADGCRDVIRQGRDGIMVKKEDHYALADAMERLIDDNELRKNLIERSLERAECFDWSRVTDNYVAIYHELSAAAE